MMRRSSLGKLAQQSVRRVQNGRLWLLLIDGRHLLKLQRLDPTGPENAIHREGREDRKEKQ
jgi:hypothetical protein